MQSEINLSNNFLTGNKDVDRLILFNLSDKNILIACKTNKYAKERVCDETFFRNLVFERYPETIKYKDYVKVRDWKNFYLSIIYYIDKLRADYKFNYTKKKNKYKEINPELEYLARKKNKYKDINPELEYLARKNVTNIQYNDSDGLTYAATRGHLPIVKYLTERGADINYLDDFALMQASANGDLQLVKYLVEHGANNKSQALIEASYRGHFPVVKYLVEHGAEVHYKDDEALHEARQNNHVEVVKYLESLQ